MLGPYHPISPIALYKLSAEDAGASLFTDLCEQADKPWERTATNTNRVINFTLLQSSMFARPDSHRRRPTPVRRRWALGHDPRLHTASLRKIRSWEVNRTILTCVSPNYVCDRQICFSPFFFCKNAATIDPQELQFASAIRCSASHCIAIGSIDLM